MVATPIDEIVVEGEVTDVLFKDGRPPIQVTDDNNHVVSGATVNMLDKTVITNEWGLAYFDGFVIYKDGLVLVTATHEDYIADKEFVTINSSFDDDSFQDIATTTAKTTTAVNL